MPFTAAIRIDSIWATKGIALTITVSSLVMALQIFHRIPFPSSSSASRNGLITSSMALSILSITSVSTINAAPAAAVMGKADSASAIAY